MPEIRRIRPGERARALETIVAAFRRDPQVRWWFPDDEGYRAGAPEFFGVLLDTRIEGGEVWVADGGLAVAMWVPPGGNLIGPELAERQYTAMIAGLPQQAGARIQRTDEAVDALLPATAHWYLGVLACHPDHHGRGLGAAVAAPVLAAADRAGLPVALETASPVNVGYYTRRGFAVIGEVRLEDAVPQAAGEPALELVAGGLPGAGAAGSGPAAVGDGLSVGVSLYVMQRQPRT
ncbi:MAG TPA: GNAT family N-acetyltransferase [Kineosporiaceae bacterium]|nr:GNAT family N-acetyltransferase [Kineosporiaceae bacterium]